MDDEGFVKVAMRKNGRSVLSWLEKIKHVTRSNGLPEFYSFNEEICLLLVAHCKRLP